MQMYSNMIRLSSLSFHNYTRTCSRNALIQRMMCRPSKRIPININININRTVIHIQQTSSSSTASSSTTTTSTSTTSTPSSSSSYSCSSSSAEETVEGVWIFHRHGDRTPNRRLIADHNNMQEEEAKFWRTKIPPINRSYYNAFCDVIPTDIHQSNNDGNFLDADCGREPYGFLTWKGMNQMYERGRQVAIRYNKGPQYRENEEDHSTSAVSATQEAALDFLSKWDVKGYSTNYLRTVMSLQCFIDGLLYSNTAPNHNNKNSQPPPPHSYQVWSEQEYKANRPPLFNHDDGTNPNPNPNPSTSNNNNNNKSNNPIISVRDRKEDTLNAFDKHPEFMKKLVADVISTPQFIQKDSQAGSCLAAKLANFLPGLTTASSYGGPSGINWIHASDHFVCRSSHNVPYSQFTHVEHDPNSELQLSAMSYSVVSHLSWRFRSWYQSPALLAAIAGPPLQEVEQQIQKTCLENTSSSMSSSTSSSSSSSTDSTTEKQKKPFIIYSCHDVTILSLLYGIGADFLSSNEDLINIGLVDTDAIVNDKPFWPKYASTLIFELVHVRPTSDGDNNNNNSGPTSTSSSTSERNNSDDDSRFIRVLLNGKPIRSLSLLENKKDVLSVNDFSKLINDLMSKSTTHEQLQNKLDGKEEGVQRDMSNWTG